MRRPPPRLVLAALATAMGACAPPPPGAARDGLAERPALEVIEAQAAAPEGADPRPARRVAFRMPDGSTRPVDRLAVGFVPRWRGGAALVDPERRLYEVHPDGTRRMLAAGAVGTVVTDEAEGRLAYVTESGFLGAIHVHDGQRDEVWAAGLASAGALRFDGDALLFAGGAPGGVVGLWEATRDGARCLTNCALRTGTDWRADFVPPPGRGDDIEPGPTAVRWTDAEGRTHEVPR